ncbi:MAG: protein kinase [Phycisphaerae bacterium]
MTCETVGELLLEYVEGELPPSQARSVQAHLDTCRACSARYRETRALLGDLGAARSVEQHAPSPGESRSQPDQPTTSGEPARLGDFEILGELGRGGMGVVYRARQISLNRVVALKVLAAGLVQSGRSVSRFAREAQAAARLHHTNIVPIYAQGHEQDYFHYAMELIEGDSLDKILRKQRQQAEDKTLVLTDRELDAAPTRRLVSAAGLLRSAVSTMRLSRVTRTVRHPRHYKRIARLLAGAAEGLHHAHEQGVVHRDIKPQNLLLGPDDQLHITDFGLARIRDEPGLTLSTEMVGTPAYMAPEQISAGGPAIDRRADVYALGVTLYEMLTLHRPFKGETYEQTINQVLNREPKPPRKLDPHIPVDLETICLRAMEKEPQRRFSNAAEMARDLRRYAEDYPITSRRVSPPGKALRWVRRHPARASAVAATALVAILVPLLLNFINATASAQIDAAFNVLLDNYREKDRALAELGWAGRIGGDRQRYDLVLAFAHVRTDPARSMEILRRLLADHSDNPDAHYLLAWAYARRAQTQGVEMWADVQQHIGLGDARAPEPKRSAEGCFFRGQAVWGIDPEDAVRSFENAIKTASREGFTFTQPMLHQGRAMNQIMYSWRALEPLRANKYYEKAVGRLEYAKLGQPNKAYPRYLLSITHLLAAEIQQSAGKPKDALEAYQKSLTVAREAQQVEPSSPRGYAAEAGYHESRGDFVAAVAAWNQFDNPDNAIETSESDRSERFEYQMRLHFWLGQYAEAERMRARRYSELTGYDPQRRYDADEGLYQALVAASAGDWDTAERALTIGVERARHNPEYLLRLDAAYRLLGQTAPTDLLPHEISAESKLSPGWTREWLAVLIGYQRGEVGWEAVKATSSTGTQRNDDPRLRMAGAHFFRGVRELAAGQRKRALEAFSAAHNHYDNENYCFRAKLLLVKLENDPAWPAWLATNDAAAP